MASGDTPEAELAGDLLAVVVALEESVTELTAIIEGRPTPPTDAEIDAHWRAGGSWLVEHHVIRGADEAKRWAAQRRDLGFAVTWRALNPRGAPCVWPAIEAAP